jgi:DNA-binding response OmpR family regulator
MFDCASVLIIDADRDIARAIGIRLQQAGFRVDTALNAETGISVANVRIPDVVVLEVASLYIDSQMVVRTLQGTVPTRAIPIVATAADSGGRSVAHAIGVAAFVNKSGSLSEVVTRVQQVAATVTSSIECVEGRQDPPHNAVAIGKPRLSHPHKVTHFQSSFRIKQ